MRKILPTVSRVLLPAIFLMACQKEQKLGKFVKFRVPSVQQDGSYILEDIEVPAPKNLETLESDLSLFGIGDSDLCPKGERSGKKPKFQFTEVAENTYSAQNDFVSLSAALIYVELQKLKLFLDGSKNPGMWEGFFPKRINFVDSMKDYTSDNAAYTKFCDQFYFLTQAKMLQLSTGLDVHIIMHELSHALFSFAAEPKFYKSHGYDYSQFKNIDKANLEEIMEIIENTRSWTSKEVEKGLLYYADSLDEGMADFFSYLMTGKLDVYNQHLKGYSSYRTIFLNPSYVEESKEDDLYSLGTKMIEFWGYGLRTIYPDLGSRQISEETRYEVFEDSLNLMRQIYDIENWKSGKRVTDKKITSLMRSFVKEKMKSKVVKDDVRRFEGGRR